MTLEQHDEPLPKATRLTTPVLGSAIVLSVLSASCCVLPISLSLLGLGGSWLALLDPFVGYRVFILGGVAVIIVWAWTRALRVRDIAARRRQTIIAGLATVVFVIAVTAPLWEAEVARDLLSIMKRSS